MEGTPNDAVAVTAAEPNNNTDRGKRRRTLSPEDLAKLAAARRAALAKKKAKADLESRQASPRTPLGGTSTESASKPANPAPDAKASVPFFITKAAEAKLRALGYSQEAIDRMPPQEAQDILKTPAHVNLSEAVIQCATEAIGVPGQPAGSPNSSDREFGKFSQIPAIDQSIPTPHRESLENMTDEKLDQFVVGHYDGLKKNTLALAEGLSEKKHRLVRKGCESGWGGWVTDTLKMSVSWADKLVRNLDVYHTFGPQVRQAAEEAGVNFAKPAVMAALRVINDEFLANGDPGILHFSACIQALKIAGMRRQNGQVVPAGAPGKSASEGSGRDPSQTKSEPKDSGHSETKTAAGDVGDGKVQDSGNADGLQSDPHAEKARRMIDEAKRQLDEAKRRQKELKDSNPVVTVDFTLADVPKDEYARYQRALKRDPALWEELLRIAFNEFIETEPTESTGKKLEILPEDDGNA
jgi:hypothetical protein